MERFKYRLLSLLSLIAVLICVCQTGCALVRGEESSRLGQYSFYQGNLHAHSVYSGDQAKVVAEKLNKGVATYEMHTPAEVLETARKNNYDFYAITDHSSPEQNEWYAKGFTEEHWQDTKAQVAKYTSSTFLALYGFEFSRNQDRENGGLGHMNVINADSWKSAYAPGNTFEALYDWLTGQKDALIVAQFNHPSLPGKPGKNFKDYAGRTKERNDVVVLAEIWNSGETMWFVGVVKKIWASGWKVAPTGGTDIHGIYGIEKRRMRTGVLAKSLAKEEILQAIQARRVYATLEPELQLEFRLNNHLMGSALEKRPHGALKAEIFAHDPTGEVVITQVKVHGGRYDVNGGETALLATLPVEANKQQVKAEVANWYDYYFVEVYKSGKDTPIAFSSPVWMDNE